MDMEFIIAQAKGIRGLRLQHDLTMLDQILAKFPAELVEKVPGTVLADDIEDRYKSSAVTLH